MESKYVDEKMEVEQDYDNTNSDESSNESDEEENENLKERNIIAQINRLQDELSMNQYDYVKHEQLIDSLSTLGELDLLRDCRERMRLLFPLSELVWLKWIKDEQSIVSTDEEKLKLIELYEAAISDYLSPKIWLSYCDYAQEEPTLFSDVRILFERAVNAIGSHFLYGRQIWKNFQAFEERKLNVNDSKFVDHLQRYISLFEKQFSIPLQGMEKDFEDFEKWLKEANTKFNIDLTKQTSKAKELFNISITYLKDYQNFEDLIAKEKDNIKKSEIYKCYLEMIIKKRHDYLPNVICLYERTIADCFNNTSLWLEYLTFCDSKLVLPEILFPIYERSIRNVPWSSDIWIRYLLAQERLSKLDSLEDSSIKIKELYERAIQNQFSTIEDYKNITMNFLNFLRRKFSRLNLWNDLSKYDSIREQFKEPINRFLQSYGEENCYELFKFQAKIEAKFLNSKEEVKSIFERLSLSEANFKHYASFWIDFATFQKDNGSEEDYRNILLKGLSFCKDYPESIGELLMKYERDESSNLDEFLSIEAKVNALNKKMAVKRAKENALHAKKIINDTNISPKKRKNDDIKSTNEDMENPPNKKPKNQILQVENSIKHGKTVQTDPLKIDQTIFLSNLSFDVEEEEIQKHFNQFGDINEVRLVRNFKGNSKGFCYVEFKDVTSVHKALQHDRMLIKERPVFITQMDKKPTFSYSLNAETNKLFVKNIPLDYTKDDVINKIFIEFVDSIKDVRLVTYRNGFSKGWAYVEFKDDKTALEAVEMKNDKNYEGKQLFVAISDPSKSSKGTGKMEDNSNKIKSGFSGFMVPTSVRIRNASQKPRLEAENESLISGKVLQSNLSNDQFRSFLNKK